MHRRRLTLTATMVGLLLTAVVAVPVLAASTTWKLNSYNPSGRALRAQVVDVAANGAVTVTFPKTADAAYLTTAKVGDFGNLAGQTLSAKVSIAAVVGTTFANYPGCTNATGDPTVGLYFQTKTTGGFNPSAYWWSGERVSLSALANSPTLLTRQLVAGQWTNYNGQTDPTGFAAAAANVTSWGVSFGGDCFYANGVGTPIGSAVFTLLP